MRWSFDAMCSRVRVAEEWAINTTLSEAGRRVAWGSATDKATTAATLDLMSDSDDEVYMANFVAEDWL